LNSECKIKKGGQSFQIFSVAKHPLCCKQKEAISCYESKCCIKCNAFATGLFATLATLKTAKYIEILSFYCTFAVKCRKIK